MSTLLATVLLLVPMAEAGAEGESGLVTALVIGGLALVLLLGSVLALMSFGKGRDHS